MSGRAEVTLTAGIKQLPALAVYVPKSRELRKAGIQIDGDGDVLDTLYSLLDPGDPNVNIVTP